MIGSSTCFSLKKSREILEPTNMSPQPISNQQYRVKAMLIDLQTRFAFFSVFPILKDIFQTL